MTGQESPRCGDQGFDTHPMCALAGLNGELAPMEEQRLCKATATGSSPVFSTLCKLSFSASGVWCTPGI